MWFKAVVMEIKDSYAIVMKSDSTMIRVKIKKDMKVGDILIFLDEDLYIQTETENIKSKTKNKAIITILSIAAVLVLFILPVLNKSNITPYAVVSLDINPSIELELDKDKKIVNVKSLNKDGSKLDLNSINGLMLDEGISKLKSILESQGYKLKNDSVIVGFTFLGDIDDIDYEDYIKSMINSNLKDSKVAYLKGNKQDYINSNKEGVSLGRYEAGLDIDEELLEEELENMSVEELLSLLKNKDVYLNEEILDEIEDQVEDKLEEDSSKEYNNQSNTNYQEDDDDDDDDNDDNDSEEDGDD